jgi:sugar fermentation stimulation protein A
MALPLLEGPVSRSQHPLLHRWPTPLVEGRLLRRYERFIAEVRVGEQVVRAHCVNPGRMEGLVVPGARVWLSRSAVEGRALPWTWELVEQDGVLVGANTALPNALVGAALTAGLVGGLEGLAALTPEQPFGRGHRVDLLGRRGEAPVYIEVKNCHLVYPDRRGYFPDSTSERATRHVEALTRLAARGIEAHVVFTLQRGDVDSLRPSALHDPAFARACRAAGRRGLKFHAVRLLPSLEGVRFDCELPVELERYALQPVRAWSAAFDATSGWERKDGRVAGRSVVVPPATRPAP